MDHSLFGCLRSPHTPAQGLHPAITQSSLSLHGRSDHVSYLDLPSSSPPYGYSGGEDNGVFSSPAHRGHLPQQEHPLHSQHLPGWSIPQQTPSPNVRHSVCLLPLEATAPELSLGGQNLCSTNPNLGSGDLTEASCVSGEYGRQSLPSEDPDRKSSKSKTDSSGKIRGFLLHFI